MSFTPTRKGPLYADRKRAGGLTVTPSKTSFRPTNAMPQACGLSSWEDVAPLSPVSCDRLNNRRLGPSFVSCWGLIGAWLGVLAPSCSSDDSTHHETNLDASADSGESSESGTSAGGATATGGATANTGGTSSGGNSTATGGTLVDVDAGPEAGSDATLDSDADALPSDGGPDASHGTLVTGNTFYRSYDGVTYMDQSHPATVSDFRLDEYEVTVAQFRQFVDAWIAGYRPASGDGKHTYLNAGQGLAATGGGFEPGWSTAWDIGVPTTANAWTSALVCGSGSSWTAAPGTQESWPVSCVTWYEAYAFCIWDGAFLPSEAEWNYAAAGGSEQRVYPWSSPPNSSTIDCTYVDYAGCPPGPHAVGSFPKGRGRYGQLDLAGGLWEWNLDFFDGMPLVTPCVDCALLTSANERVLMGDRSGGQPQSMVASYRNGDPPANRSPAYGVRCARAP